MYVCMDFVRTAHVRMYIPKTNLYCSWNMELYLILDTRTVHASEVDEHTNIRKYKVHMICTHVSEF